MSSCAPHTHTHTHTREKPGVPERKKSLSAQPWCFLHLSYYYYCRFFFFGLAREHVRSAAVLRGVCCLPASKKKKKRRRRRRKSHECTFSFCLAQPFLFFFPSGVFLSHSDVATRTRKQTNKQKKKKNAYNTAHPRQPHFVLRQETSIFSLHETTNSERLRNERGKKNRKRDGLCFALVLLFLFVLSTFPSLPRFFPSFFFLQLYTSS